MNNVVVVVVLVIAFGCLIFWGVSEYKYLRSGLSSDPGLERDDDTSPIIGQDVPQLFTIDQLRRAMLPGLSDDQYEEMSYRISVRSAIFAIRKMGLVPANSLVVSKIDTSKIRGEEVILIPGFFERRSDNADGLGNWQVNFLLPNRSGFGSTPIECDIYGESLVVAVHPRSKYAGKFPPEFEEKWERGENFHVETKHGTVVI